MSFKLISASSGGGSGVSDGKYVRTTRFAIINSGSSGTITKPTSSTIVLDDFGGTTDAVVATSSASLPEVKSARTSGGVVVATSFDTSGNWSLTGTPSSYPIAIVYRVKQLMSDFDSTSSDIWGVATVEADTTETEITLSDITTLDSSTTKHGFLKKLSNNVGEYMAGTGAWTTVISALLTGLSTATSTDVTATDSVVVGIGKLQAKATNFYDASRFYFLFEDYDAASKIGSNSSGGTISGGQTGFSNVNIHGVSRMRVTTVAQYTNQFADINSILFGGATWTFESNFYLPALSNGTDGFIYRLGFGDQITSSDAVDGAYFEYDSATSANWRYCTAAASTRTKTNSSTAVTSAKWIVLKIVVNAAASAVEFFINGSSIGTITTNIPSGSNYTGIWTSFQKTVGSSVVDGYIDYLLYKAEWTSGNRYT